MTRAATQRRIAPHGARGSGSGPLFARLAMLFQASGLGVVTVSLSGGFLAGCDADPATPSAREAPDPVALLARAQAARAAGDAPAAEAAYAALLRAAPLHPGASLEFGRWLVELDRIGEATPLLRHATLLDPLNGAAHVAFGEVLERAGEATLAIVALERAVTLETTPEPSTWRALARATAKIGEDPERAAEAYVRASEAIARVTPERAADDLVEAARQFLRAHDQGAARAALESALLLRPDHAQARDELARLP